MNKKQMELVEERERDKSFQTPPGERGFFRKSEKRRIKEKREN